MVSTNDKNQSSRKPAENYRERARAVLKHTFMVMQGIAGPEKWKEPTEQEMERFIDEFHRLLNLGIC